MKLTNKQIRQIIKEELDKVLNETMHSPAHDKLVDLIATGQEGLNQALELFDQVKGTGMLQPFEEDHIQRLSDYANASYTRRSLIDQMAAIRQKLGVAARTHTTWRALRKKRAAAFRAMRELEHNINQKDKKMIAQASGVY